MVVLRRNDRRSHEAVLLGGLPRRAGNSRSDHHLSGADGDAGGLELPAWRPGGGSGGSPLREVYVPALRWRGPAAGYAFKLGILGLGYYQDSLAPPGASLQAEAAADAPRTPGGGGGGEGEGEGGNGGGGEREAQSPLHPLDNSTAANGGDPLSKGSSARFEAGFQKAADATTAAPAVHDAETAFGGVAALHAPNGALW